MASERRLLTLGDLGPIVTGRTPPTSVKDYFGGNVPFVTPRDMDGRKIIDETERFLTEAGKNAVARAVIPSGSIMVSCIGSDMGKVAIAGRECVTNQQINSIIVSDEYCADYIYYNLSMRKTELRSLASGSAQPILNKGHFSQVRIPLPSKKEQERIAHILGTLDDKIELNRRMNWTIEKMAQAIFKSWFIDFDPVRAKAEGRDPNLPKEIADLFPNSFEDSELGPIPKGWTIAKVEDIAEKVACGPFGSSIKVSTFVSEGIPVISGQHLNGIRLFDGKYNFITLKHAEKLKNANVFRGDVIFTHAGNIGQVAFIPETSKYDRYVLSQRQFYLRCDHEKVSPFFMAHYFRSSGGQHTLLANTSSTGVPSISRPVSYLKSIKFILPPTKAINRFDDYVKPLHLLAAKLEAESQTLTILRDTFLPKLISGELRVPYGEKFIEEAGVQI